MPWRQLLRYFTNNEQLIQKLSETGPIRYAARMTVYWFIKAKDKGHDTLKQSGTESTEESGSLKSFGAKFKNELRKGLEELENEKKNRP